jgi:hypothetical protein
MVLDPWQTQADLANPTYCARLTAKMLAVITSTAVLRWPSGVVLNGSVNCLSVGQLGLDWNSKLQQPSTMGSVSGMLMWAISTTGTSDWMT